MAEGEDGGWDGKMSEYRQRHPNGNAELLAQLRRHFRLGCALESSRACETVSSPQETNLRHHNTTI